MEKCDPGVLEVLKSELRFLENGGSWFNPFARERLYRISRPTPRRMGNEVSASLEETRCFGARSEGNQALAQNADRCTYREKKASRP
jgi:hypothetical protein